MFLPVWYPPEEWDLNHHYSHFWWLRMKIDLYCSNLYIRLTDCIPLLGLRFPYNWHLRVLFKYFILLHKKIIIFFPVWEYSLPLQLQLPEIIAQTENNIKTEYSDQNFQLRIYYSVCFTFYNYNRSWQLFVSLNPTLCSLPKSKLNHLRQMVV